MTARIQLCGQLEIELGGERHETRLPGLQGPLVVALLVWNRARPVARDELVDALWPGAPPADPGEALSALLSKVRRTLGKDLISGRRELTLALPADAEVDVEQAFAAASRADAAVADGDWPAALDAGRAVVGITGRGFLVGLDTAWTEARRVELAELRLRGLEAVARAGVALGGPHLAHAERAARELIRSAPLREAGHRLLMEALAARGETAEALAAYEDLRAVLRDELGTAPGEEARALHARLLSGTPVAPQPAAAPTPSGTVPLPALLARERGDLVGREPELARLRAAWADARAGHRGLVLLAGGPGIGKTRLAGALARFAHPEATVLYAACEEDGLVAYQPFVDALRQYARSAPLDVGRLGPGAAELARLIPELAGDDPEPAPGAPDDPEARRYLLFQAVSALLDQAAARGPVLLVVDDLHWADRATLKLLRHVVRAPDEAALLIVGTYRDAEIGPAHPMGDVLADLRRDGLFERVSLPGLDRDGVGALIEAHAGQPAPSALVRALHAETEGNPFFVGEVVRHLVETGGMVEREGRWSPLRSPGGIGVPEGVKEVLTRRLARLSEPSRTLLAHAAVLGREFPFELLPAMSGSDEETVIGALEEALGARLVVEAPDAVYAFTHALVRETLYASLSAPRRQRMHAAAARAIEAAPAPDADAQAAALAVHFRLAGSAGDPAKAIEYSLRAGERARRLFAWDEAAAHWDGALTAMERAGADPAGRAQLLVGLAVLYLAIGDPAHQIACLERALALYDGLGDGKRSATVHSRLGQAYALVDSIYAEHLDIGRAFAHFDAARPVLEQGSPRARGYLETGVSGALFYRLEIQAGKDAGAEAIAIGEHLGDEALTAAALEAWGWHEVVSGRLRAGLAAEERAFAMSDRGRRPYLAWMALNCGAQLTWGLADPDRAQALYERQSALPYAGETQYRRLLADGLGRCHILRGEVAEARRHLPDAIPSWMTHALRPLVDLWEGDWDAVAALAQETLATSRRTGNRWDEQGSLHLAGRVHLLRGELDQACAALDGARAICAAGGARFFELWVLPDLARATAAAGRVGEARAHVDRCHAIMGDEDWRGRRGIVALAEAVVLSHEERPGEAAARFASALEVLREFRLAAEEADCLHEWGRALDRDGDGAGAAERLAAATEVYRRRGAGAIWLERGERGR